MMERIETVIVGGGQAGLATSYCLTQQGREHVVLEDIPRQPAAARQHRICQRHASHLGRHASALLSQRDTGGCGRTPHARL